MNSFKEFGIKPKTNGFTGDKIKIERILNREITVHDYKIVESLYAGKCLHLQISIVGTMHVLFTGSRALMEQIEQVSGSQFPFAATIIKENERFEFS